MLTLKLQAWSSWRGMVYQSIFWSHLPVGLLLLPGLVSSAVSLCPKAFLGLMNDDVVMAILEKLQSQLLTIQLLDFPRC